MRPQMPSPVLPLSLSLLLTTLPAQADTVASVRSPDGSLAVELDLNGEGRLAYRVLRKGAGIGLHPHDHDEIYYVLAGRGRYVLDGREHAVAAGDVLLTRAGSTHAILQDGEADLELLIVYLSRSAH